jgi:chromosomal replication initiation ATPase DnaA
MKINPYYIPGLIDSKVLRQIELAKYRMPLTTNNILEMCMSILNNINETSFTLEDVKSKSRKNEVVEIRHFASYHLREVKRMTWLSIGKLLGNRDHSTALNGHRRWESWEKSDHKVRQANKEFKQVFGL